MIDWTKPVRTKGCKIPVKILSLEGPGDQTVVGYVDNGDTDVYQWFPGGGFCRDPQASPMDLENVPEVDVYSFRVQDLSLGSDPGGRVKWWVIRNNPTTTTRIAICDTYEDADTITNLLNGTR